MHFSDNSTFEYGIPKGEKGDMWIPSEEDYEEIANMVLNSLEKWTPAEGGY
jgi:hypothetical protein